MTLKRSRLKSELPKQATYSVTRRGVPSGAEGDGETGGAAVGGDRTNGASASARTPTLDRTTTSKRRLQRRYTPLDILQQPLQLAGRKVFDLRRFLLVIALTVITLLLPTPEGLSEEGQRALALFVFTGSILALEPAPLPISALLVPVAQVALGIDTVSGAFAAFGQPSVFLILTSLFLAEALRKHGITRRLALYSIAWSKGRFATLMLSIMVITALLSMWVQNTATTAVLIPVAITIVRRIPDPADAKRALPLLIMAVAYGASVGGLATIVGSGENAIASGVLNQVAPFGFMDWMKYGLPVALILLPASWWLLLRTGNAPDAQLDTMAVLREIRRSGGLSPTEREIVIVLFICIFLWVTGEQIETWLGLPNTLLSSVVVSIGAVAYLSFAGLIDWNDVKGVNWGVFLVIGAGFTLGDALNKTGANAWIASQAQPLLGDLPYAIVLLIVMLISFVITQFINDVTLGAIFSPILVALAQALGIPPAQLVVPTILAVGLAYMFPSASARMTLVAVTGAVDRHAMLRTGLLIGLPSVLFVFVFFLLLNAVGLI
jgi:sodium-dependent dicarboxylate transporter 2/3/5